jgi:putative hydrolase of the HAD superfamily
VAVALLAMACIEAVVFDYGGVLVTSPFAQIADVERHLHLPAGAINELLGYGLTVPEPAPGEPPTNKWHLLETGEIELDEYAEWVHGRSAEVLGNPLDLRSMMGRGFTSMSVLWPMIHEARQLKAAGYRLAILTNNIAPFRNTWLDQLPVELFDVIVDSSAVGRRKPDPAIYRLTCELLEVPPERCVFLDDHPVNVRAAEALGMHGVLVTDDEVLDAIERLRALLTRAEGPSSATGIAGC